MATLTVYSNSSDGLMYAGGTSNWAATRGATSGTTYKTGAASDTQGAQAEDFSSQYYINRAYLAFDTSSIGDTDTIDSATLSVYGLTNAASDVMAMKGTFSEPLVSGDFDAFTGSSYGNVSWSTGAYNDISLNSTGLTDINKTGTTKYVLRENTHDYLDSAPSATSYYNGMYFSEQTGTTNDPKLVVNYTPPASGPSASRRMIVMS